MAHAVGEEPAGTAPVARTWLLVEQPGPWGADALNESRLDPVVAAELGLRAKRAGARVALIRRPRQPGHASPDGPRCAYLVMTEPGVEDMRRIDFADPVDLLALDLADPAGWPGERVREPLLLVCTNGKRDVCCALAGRPLALAVGAAHPGAVWECTHLGGHRFAPTAVVLPSGYAYGWLDAGAAERVLAQARAGGMVPEGCRGRSTWSRPGQCAELAVRSLLGESDAAALRVADAEPVEPAASDGPDALESWRVLVRHRDGRTWSVRVAARQDEGIRPDGCGKAPSHPTRLVVSLLTAA